MKKWIEDLSIGMKISAAFLIIIGIGAIAATSSYINNSATRVNVSTITEKSMPAIQTLNDVSIGLSEGLGIEYFLVNGAKQVIDKNDAYALAETDMKKVSDGLKKYEDSFLDESKQEVWKKLSSYINTWNVKHQQLLTLSKQKDQLISIGTESSSSRISKIEKEMVDITIASLTQYQGAKSSIQSLLELEEDNVSQLSSLAQASAKKTSRNTIGIILIAITIGVIALVMILKYINTQIRNLAVAANKLAKGDINVELNIESKDEFGFLARAFEQIVIGIDEKSKAAEKISAGVLDIEIDVKSEKDVLSISMNRMVHNLNSLVLGVSELTRKCSEGKLDMRADEDKYTGGYKEIVKEINATLDSVIGPLNVAAEYVDRISKGDIPPRITDEYKGDFNEIKNNINGLIEYLNLFISEMMKYYQEHLAGNTLAQMPVDKFAGVYAKMSEGVNNVSTLYVDAFKKVIVILNAYAKGDFSATLERMVGRQALLNDALDVIRDSLINVSAEVNNLIDAGVNGKLDVRGNASKFEGDFAKIVQGINEILDSVIGPLNVTAEYVDRISKGDIPPRITDNYKGDFNEIKNNVNGLIDYLSIFVSEMGNFHQEHEQGNTLYLMPVEKFAGVYAEMAKAVNRIADIYIQVFRKEFEILEEYSKGDFSKQLEKLPGRQGLVNEYLDKLRDSLMLVSSEVNSLIDAGVNGKLDVRGDTSKFEGDFAKITQGINAILDAIVTPIQEAAVVMSQMSEGVMTGSMKGNYKGDFALLKDNLNNSLKTLGGYSAEVCYILSEMADKNLDLTLKQDYRGDFTVMKDALNNMISSLSEFVADINSAAEAVASGSKQVSISSHELSQGSTEQASSVEEITAAMTQIAAQTKQNAINANEANDVSSKVREGAEKGNTQMNEMLKAMDEINKSSADISKIIKVIDEIAFQTNILALNAAVEAARAGQHGKGFAVVAEEVRNLAARSANAAKETTDLIEGSIMKVEAGTKIANETATALSDIVQGVTKTYSLVADIASASNEQATGITQINTGITQVSNVTQANTATAEESAAASEELSGQALLLKDKVNEFKLANYSKHNSYEKVNEINPPSGKKAKQQALPQKASKIKISLDDSDFGKY